MHLYQQVLASCPIKQNTIIYHTGRSYWNVNKLINRPDKLLSKCVTSRDSDRDALHIVRCVTKKIALRSRCPRILIFKMGPSTGTNKQFSLKFSLSVCFSYESKKKNDIDYKRLKELNSTVFGNLPYILPSNPHPNPIRTSFSRFLKQKMSVRGSNPHLSFNSPLPTRQTDSVMSDDGESDE